MPQNTKLNRFITVEDYLNTEDGAEVRHEYLAGEVYAMSGGTRNHNRLAGNIFAFLDQQIDINSCKHFINDVKVRIQSLESDTFYYPDVVVTCDPDDDNELYIEKPTTIFEVLSDSTERIDRQEKFFGYRTISSLEEYVLISQKSREVTVARKSNSWKPELLTGNDFELKLSCSDQPITSDKIYRNVDIS